MRKKKDIKDKNLKVSNIVEKRNILNESIYNMTLNSARLFSVYLSKINPRDIKTRSVRFKLDEFVEILGIDRIQLSTMERATSELLSIVINVRNDEEGYDAFQMFSKCRVRKTNTGQAKEWVIDIDAHDDSLPLIFDFKEKYFKYQVGNVLRLNSFNKMRMYEFLKQYEHAGLRIVTIEHLKKFLGIEIDRYNKFNDFKVHVLETCRKALAENTDIKFTYEAHGKRGERGKILELKFTITKNDDYKDQLSLDMYNRDGYLDEEGSDSTYRQLSLVCDDTFSISEIIVLCDLMLDKLDYDKELNKREMCAYLEQRYNYLKMRDEKRPIKNKFAYIKTLIGKELGAPKEIKALEETERQKKKREYIRSLYV